MRHSVLLFALLSSAGALTAQTIQLARTGGTLGKPLTVTLSGTPKLGFLLLTSLNAGPTPLKILDASDPRVLEAGLDLLPLLLVGATGPGPLPIGFPLPGDPGLSGKTLHFHAFLFPGANRFAGPLSNPLRQTLGTGNTWVARGKVFAEARALTAIAPLAGNGYLLAGGGAGNLLGARGLITSEIFDADRQLFRQGPKMSTPRALHHAVALADGRVLVVGGVNSLGVPLRTCELYDPKTNTFTPTGSMRLARAGHTADLLPSGNVLVTGGTTNLTDAVQAINNAQRSTEIYDAKSGTWSNGPNLSRPRLAHVAVPLLNGRILITGGATYTTFIIKIPSITSTCELYDPSGNSFSGTGSMPNPRAAHALTMLKDGKVLASGGARLQSITNIVTIANAATFDPASGGRWTATASSMRIARAIHATALLPDGRVLVIGGATGSLTAPGSTARCDFFHPLSRSFTAAPDLGTGRAAAAALLLPAGQVFVAGGGGGVGNQALPTGEMYFVP